MKPASSIFLLIFIFSVLLYDIFTKGMGGIILDALGLHDILQVGVLLMVFMRFRSRFDQSMKLPVIMGGLLILFLVGKLLMGRVSNESFIFFRDAQFIYRSLILTVIVFYFWGNPTGSKHLFKIWRWGTWLVCICAWLYMIAYLDGNQLNFYGNFRVIVGIPQATAFFAEPALMGQFLVATLFILFRNPLDIRQHKILFLFCIITLLASQSAGSWAGLLLWSLYMFLRRSKEKNTLFIKVSVIFFLFMSFTALVTFFPENRVSIFLRGPEKTGSGSAGRRVQTEIIALGDFLSTTPIVSRLIGLSSYESKLYREKRMLVAYRDDIAGNGLVEFILRYGILGLALLLAFFYTLSGKCIPRFVLLCYFFGIITQIDGAIAKPWIFTYTMVFIISMMFPPYALQRASVQDRHPASRLPKQNYPPNTGSSHRPVPARYADNESFVSSLEAIAFMERHSP